MVVIMIVVMIVPVVVGVPTMGILIPPAVIVSPAPFTGIAQFVAPVVGLFAIRAVMLDRFVQLVIGMGNARLTIVLLIGAHPRGTGQE